MTARQTLRFTASFIYVSPRAAIEQRVAETLDPVGLADKADLHGLLARIRDLNLILISVNRVDDVG